MMQRALRNGRIVSGLSASLLSVACASGADPADSALFVTTAGAPAPQLTHSASKPNSPAGAPNQALGESAAVLEFTPTGYKVPSDWMAHSASNPKTVDPINVVITDDSLFANSSNLQGLSDFIGPDYDGNRWQAVNIGFDVNHKTSLNCISEADASVEMGTTTAAAPELISWRPGGCDYVLSDARSSLWAGVASALGFDSDGAADGGPLHNHLRGWQQSGGAWFLAVSEEHVCFKAHCIDSNGFDNGREDFLALICRAAQASSYGVSYRWDEDPARPAGTGSGGVPYGPEVLVITVRAGADFTGCRQEAGVQASYAAADAAAAQPAAAAQDCAQPDAQADPACQANLDSQPGDENHPTP